MMAVRSLSITRTGQVLDTARSWVGAEGSARNEAQPIEAKAKRTPKEAF